MKHVKPYLAIITASASVLILGCWNPTFLQEHKNGNATGRPNYLLISIISLLVGVLAIILLNSQHKIDKEFISNMY